MGISSSTLATSLFWCTARGRVMADRNVIVDSTITPHQGRWVWLWSTPSHPSARCMVARGKEEMDSHTAPARL